MRFQDVAEEASDLLADVKDLLARVETALRQLDENRHYELWSSFCESRGDLGQAQNALARLNRPFANLNVIFGKLSSKSSLDAGQKQALLLEAEGEVESAEQELSESKRLYEAAQEPDPDDLPPNLD